MRDAARASRHRLEELPDEAWERLAGNSFFASQGFLGLWRLKGGRPVYWRVEDAGSAAFLPGIEYGRGPIARFVSMPDGCYGGVIVDPPQSDARGRLSRMLLDAVVRHGYAKTCVFDYYGTVAPHEAFRPETNSVRLVDISDPAWVPPDPKLRSQIRKAEREGIRIERFDWDLHHAGFLSLVNTAARYHRQRPRYAPDFYRALARLAQTDRRVRWSYCAHDGRPAASHIYFVERDTLQAWQSHFDRAFSFLKPNPFIRYTLCRELASEGIRWLNLGASPSHAAGVANFKARWGGSDVLYSSWTRWAGLGALVNALARSAPKRVEAPESE